MLDSSAHRLVTHWKKEWNELHHGVHRGPPKQYHKITLPPWDVPPWIPPSCSVDQQWEKFYQPAAFTNRHLSWWTHGYVVVCCWSSNIKFQESEGIRLGTNQDNKENISLTDASLIRKYDLQHTDFRIEDDNTLDVIRVPNVNSPITRKPQFRIFQKWDFWVSKTEVVY